MEIHDRPCDAEGVTLLALDGGLDHSNGEAFVQKMDDLLQQGTSHVVLDLERLTYASSLGLAALVRIHHHYAVRGGRIAFANLHSAVATLLRLSHLDRLFDLYPTVDEAVASAARGAAETSDEA
jgi:anti-sigma B factor antagonist